MNKKKEMTVRRLLSGVLAMLGFAGCSDDKEDPSVLYGCPTLTYHVAGKVTSSEGDALEGVQVIVKGGYDNEEYNGIVSFTKGEKVYLADTIYTDKKGEYLSATSSTSVAIPKLRVVFNDPNGTFAPDSLDSQADNLPQEKVKEGGNWYMGEFEVTADIQLKKK